MNRLGLLILAATVAAPALACSPSKPPTLFEDVAPGARNILAFRIESLELQPVPDELEQHRIKAKIRVLKKYRESGDDFEWLSYTNTVCQGRRLDVGGIYLVATNSSGPLIELTPSDQTLLDLSGLPLSPGNLLSASPTIKALLAALSGNGDFKLSNNVTTLRMQRGLPPPEVPPPEGMCRTLVRCETLPPAPAPTDR